MVKQKLSQSIKMGMSPIIKILNQRQRKTFGFALIDALVGLFIASILCLTFLTSIHQASVTNSHARDRQTASLALLETYEVVTALANRDFNIIASAICITSNPCYITHSNGHWSITNGTEILNDTRFNRYLTIEEVYRDTNFNITSSGGNIDTNTLLIEIAVNWTARDENFTDTITAYIHKIN